MRLIELRRDTTLDFDDLQAKLSERTRVVAFAWASNAVGTIVDAARACRLAHSGGAGLVDAVHYAAHEPIDVRRDRRRRPAVLALQVLRTASRDRLRSRRRAESWRPYKARPAPMEPLGRRFETGTLPYELLAGFNATIDYLDSIGGFAAIVPYERGLGERFLADDLRQRHRLRAADDRGPRADLPGQRRGCPAAEVATTLGERGIGVWAHNSWYSLNLYKRLGYQARRSGSASSTTTPPRRSTASSASSRPAGRRERDAREREVTVGVRIVRTAQASWSGTVPDGGGRLALGSGAFEGPYSLRGRVEQGQHTANPEELIGLANAACYTMSLADLLSGEGHPPAELATDARVHLEEGETNWSITRIELHTVGKVDGVDAAEFERLAAAGEGDLPGVARARGNGDHAGCGIGAVAARTVAKSDTVART